MANHYENKKEKFEDYNSSAYSLIVVGAIGIIALVANLLGVYSLPFQGPMKYVSYIVMFGMFIAFIVLGFSSKKSAAKVKQQMHTEEAQTKEISAWLSSNTDAATIDKCCNINCDTDNENDLYFARTDYLKSILSDTFPDADPLFIENLVEEKYDSIF